MLATVAIIVGLRVLPPDPPPGTHDGAEPRSGGDQVVHAVIARATGGVAAASGSGAWVLLQTAPGRYALLGEDRELRHSRHGGWHVFGSSQSVAYVALRQEVPGAREVAWIRHRLTTDGPRTDVGRALLSDPAFLTSLEEPSP